MVGFRQKVGNRASSIVMTTMLTAKNIISGQNIYNVWEVIRDTNYHEKGNAGE
jgi:hypothetical protein